MSSGGPVSQLLAPPSAFFNNSTTNAQNPLTSLRLLASNPTTVTACQQLLELNLQSQQAAKLKRGRQRVDAGEPRNTYQNPKMNTLKREHSISASNENGFNVKFFSGNDSDEPEEVPSKFVKPEESETSDENMFAQGDWEMVDDAASEQAMRYSTTPENEDDDGRVTEETEPSGTSVLSNSSSRRKSFHPQRQIANSDNILEPELSSGGGLDDSGKAEENETAAEANGGDDDDVIATESPAPETNEAEEHSTPPPLNQNNNYLLNMMSMMQPHLNGLNNAKLQEMLEVQRRIASAAAANQAEKNSEFVPPVLDKSPHLAQLHQTQHQEVQQNIFRLGQCLKEELNVTIDKVITEYRNREMRAFMERMVKLANATNEMQQQMIDLKQHFNNQQRIAAAAASFLIPKSVPSIYNSNPPTTTAPTFNAPAMSNFLAAAAAVSSHNSATPTPNGIFPAPNHLHPGLGPFSAINNQLANSNPMMRSNNSLNEIGPIRKKRSKVTDSLRVNKTCIVRDSSSLPASERSSPMGNSYFPPTMVNHPLYNSTNFNNDDRDISPENSDSFSDGGHYDGPYPPSQTLTPVHLRKAKLMFFYTRYPSSSLLKSYFPDIRFNKHNTAQLVKWFSNFREFFYMQMEKYARQALTEGVEHRGQIHVSEESDIYKQLNQHYNRNNLFPPPPKLREVIQETLREFYDAIKENRDAEPSWKKAIYKIITRMDDPIPEHFKHPSFMTSLE